MSNYGCHNKPRPVADHPIKVQDGHHSGIFDYESGATDRIDRVITVPFVMSTDCQYTKMHSDDPECSNCQHQQK